MILGILGSAADDSVTRVALNAVKASAAVLGAEFGLIDLAVEFRELHDLSEYGALPAGSQTVRLRERVAASSAIVLATPVYHGSYSGLIKNALDHLVNDSFAGRPVGILASAGNPRTGLVACDHLRTVVRALGGWATPTHVATASTDFVDGRPSPDIADRINTMVSQLLQFPGQVTFSVDQFALAVGASQAA
jgi:NAD(P)H-dependent FMN reductase